MVARRGRGAKAQPANPPPATEPDFTENIDTDDNNVEDQSDAPIDESILDDPVEEGGEAAPEAGADGDEAVKKESEADASEEKPEVKVEVIESGKVLVENLPASYLFDYQEKLKEIFEKHGEITNVKRGPMIVSELTTTPSLSAIVEFKNKDSLDKALSENDTVVDGNKITVSVESRTDAVLVGLPYEANSEYVKNLFSPCGEISQIHEFSRIKYKILRVTFTDKESVERALKLDKELRINGFLVTVNKYLNDDEQKQNNAKRIRFDGNLNDIFDKYAPVQAIKIKTKHISAPWLTEKIKALLKEKADAKSRFKANASEKNKADYTAIRNLCNRICRDAQKGIPYEPVEKPEDPAEQNNKRPHQQNAQTNNNNRNANSTPANNTNQQRNNNTFRGGRGGGPNNFNNRGNFRGGRGRGVFPARGGGGFPRGGFPGGMNNFMPPNYMQRPGGFMDGQRPNKRIRQM